MVAQGRTPEELDLAYPDHLRFLHDLAREEHQSHDEGGGRDRQWSLDFYLVVVRARVPLRYTGHRCGW